MNTDLKSDKNGSRFLFSESCYEKQIDLLLNSSVPKKVLYLDFIKVEKDFNLGNFIFYLKNEKGVEFQLPFIFLKSVKKDSLNSLWNFLETLVDTKEAILLSLMYASVEYFIYVKPVDKIYIRFCIFNTLNLVKKQNAGKILNYSISEADIDLDVIIKRKSLIKDFYFQLKQIFKTSDCLTFFEKPVVDYNFWQKESEIIKEYIKRKPAIPK